MTLKEKGEKIFHLLDTHSSDKIEFLEFRSPFELLISVILSAQTTDISVNRVTPLLFETYPTALDLSLGNLELVEKIIHSTGFYKNKARNIIGASKSLVENFNSIVPFDMDSLLTIPGIGRKSANVIIGRFSHPGAIIVDTHFMRVVHRLGLVSKKDPYTIEMEIKELIEEKKQYRFSMIVNLHGRRVCFSRTPSCKTCILSHLCDYLMVTGISTNG
ncbi:MAG: endonuclease III [Spirochaetia bacterium]|nr:endonuclease III [Spirochaetia bacterium]